MKKALGIVILSMLTFACVHRQPDVIYLTIDYFVGSSDFIKYKRIAILPFTEQPNASQSGQTVQELTGQIFSKYGFDVIERARLFDVLNEQKFSLTGAIDNSQALQIGKLLGARAIVLGAVSQCTNQQRRPGTVDVPFTSFSTGKTTCIPRQELEWNENFFSLALRVIDVETGQLIYSGSGYFDRSVIDPPRQMAELILSNVVRKWLETPGIVGFTFKIAPGGVLVDEIVRPSPAVKAGLQKGDRILVVNGKSIPKTISQLEFKKLTWGRPGEKVVLDVQRDNDKVTFKVRRTNRPDF